MQIEHLWLIKFFSKKDASKKRESVTLSLKNYNESAFSNCIFFSSSSEVS